MPRERVSFLLVAVALASIMLPAIVEAQPLASPPFTTPPRVCTFSLGGGASVQMEAGPDLTKPKGLAATFPVPDVCPKDPETGSPFPGGCQKWQYRWIYTGVNPSQSFVSFDTDATVFATEPSASVSDILEGDSQSGAGLNIAGERILRFNANATTFSASFWTPLRVSVGTQTGGFHSGKNTGFCAIAGADNIVGDNVGPAPVTTTKVDEYGVCQISLSLDPKGCPTGVTATSSDPSIPCVVNEVAQLAIGSGHFDGGQCGKGFTTSGSPICTVYYCPTSFGTCFTVTYDKGSGTCP